MSEQPQRIITEQELKQHDGQEGRPAWIVHDGKVYDVTNSRLWKQGMHARRHHAGQDLSADFPAAPHDASVFQRVPPVGVLGVPPPEPEQPSLLDRFFDLHPHPVSVHFPIAYVAGTALLLVLYLLTGNAIFETVAYYVLWFGVVMSPVAAALGALSWWINYGHRLTPRFQLKIAFSAAVTVLGIVALVLRATQPQALLNRAPLGWVYVALVATMVGLVAALGWIGARIVYTQK